MLLFPLLDLIVEKYGWRLGSLAGARPLLLHIILCSHASSLCRSDCGDVRLEVGELGWGEAAVAP
jgi:hypothetical protein